MHLQGWWSIRFFVFLCILVIFSTLCESSGDNFDRYFGGHLKVRSKRGEGQWGKWSAWTKCSRKCGGGIRTQTRECQIRRGVQKYRKDFEDWRLWKNVSTRFCEGHSTRHHLCNTQVCPSGSVNFRESQCQAFNQRPFMGKKYQWKSFVDHRKPCALTCQACELKRKNCHRFFATLNESVIDGTPCHMKNRSPFDLQVCIQGQCSVNGQVPV